jgi:hypothetical protein
MNNLYHNVKEIKELEIKIVVHRSLIIRIDVYKKCQLKNQYMSHVLDNL